MTLRVWAAWTGAGTTGGDASATNINDLANWAGGVNNGDFSTIVSDVALRLTADYDATNGINFVERDMALSRHIKISGTNTLTFSGLVPGYGSSQVSILLPSNVTSTVTLEKGLTVVVPAAKTCSVWGCGSLFVDAQLTGAGAFSSKYGLGWPIVVLRNDDNNFTGAIGGTSGSIHFTSSAKKSMPSALGASTSVIDFNNCRFIYIGPRDSASDRGLAFQNKNSILRNDSAGGGLCLTGALTLAATTGLNLGGISASESLLSQIIYNSTKLVKQDSGTWRLTGNNTFTGWTTDANHVNVKGGTLIADYVNDSAGAGSNRLFAAGRTLYFENGGLEIRGKAGAGNTTWQEFETNTLSSLVRACTLTVDGNGGDGTTVLMGPFAGMAGDYIGLLIAYCGNASVRTRDAVPADSGAVRNINGVLMGNSGRRANILVKDPNGLTGFATQNDALEIVRLTNTLALTADNATKADHVSLAANLTRTADLNFSTLSLDGSANDVTLDLGGFSFQTDDSAVGRGIVVNGSHLVTMRNGTHGAQGTTHIHNYGTGELSWELNNSTRTYAVYGPGLTEFTQTLGNTLYVIGGIARLTAATAYTAGALYLRSEGVLEIGADLNSTTPGDFSRSLGDGSNKILLDTGGGFSAYGEDRTVNLGGSGATAMWNSGSFVLDGFPFILSSSHANATLIFENVIDLNTRTREIRVRDGSAAIDARLTGRIFGTQYSALVKSGDGTLELTGPQDYRGFISVIGGGLRLGANDVFAGGTNALVLSGATLDAGAGRNTFDTLELIADSVIEAGNGTATLAFADCSDKTWTGTLTVNGKLGAATLRFGADGNGLTAAQLASISNRDRPVYLDAQGYLRQIPGGTVLSLQ